MIPKSIDKSAVLAAIAQIDKEGVPAPRLSRTYNIQFRGKLYPPKYVISLANKIKNGHELPPFEFGGGKEANSFLSVLEFTVVNNKGLQVEGQKKRKAKTGPKEHTTNPIKVTIPTAPSKANMATESDHENMPDAVPEEKMDTALRNERIPVIMHKEQMSVVTVTLHCKRKDAPNNQHRMNMLEQVVVKLADNDVILMPAGFFEYDSLKEMDRSKLIDSVSEQLKSIHTKAVMCFGVDTDSSRDQLAIAIDQTGLLAMGRKFHPTSEEAGYIRQASEFNGNEVGYSRIFTKADRKFYLAVCYDGFGIRHRNTINPGVDAALILAHGFYPRGEGGSGDVDFARKGFAGASMQWQCPVFGTAVFFNREIPENWPTGVRWYGNGKSVRTFKYQDNTLHWENKQMISTRLEDALCYQYHI